MCPIILETAKTTVAAPLANKNKSNNKDRNIRL